MHVGPSNQFSHFVLHPTSHHIKPKLRFPALLGSIGLGIISLGFVHLGCAIALKKKQWHIQKQNKKAQKIFKAQQPEPPKKIIPAVNTDKQLQTLANYREYFAHCDNYVLHELIARISKDCSLDSFNLIPLSTFSEKPSWDDYEAFRQIESSQEADAIKEWDVRVVAKSFIDFVREMHIFTDSQQRELSFLAYRTVKPPAGTDPVNKILTASINPAEAKTIVDGLESHKYKLLKNVFEIINLIIDKCTQADLQNPETTKKEDYLRAHYAFIFLSQMQSALFRSSVYQTIPDMHIYASLILSIRKKDIFKN